jgi:hypothetical protein
MTEIDDYDDQRKESKQQQQGLEDLATITMRSESSEETNDENTSGVRRVQDRLERQARHIAEQDFAQMERNWDKYMFEHMDENTAKFIILKHVHDGK